MKVNKKSTTKAKVLTVALLILFLGSCAVLIFAICTGQLSRKGNVNPTDSTTPTETVVSTVANTEIPTTALTEQTTQLSTPAESTPVETVSSALSLGTSYDAECWVEYNADNNSSGLAVLFGAHTRKVSVNFSDENKFLVSVNDNVEVASGTFSVVSDNEIELRYDNSYIATAEIIETADGMVTLMDFPMDIEDTTLRLNLNS